MPHIFDSNIGIGNAKNVFRHAVITASKCLCLFLMLVVGVTGGTKATAQKQEKTDKAVEPTHWGKVSGQVYDAITGAPIEGASIVIRHEGVLDEKGRATGKTNRLGRYECDGMLGRVSSNLDIGRALSGGLISVLGGSANNETKRIDISRLTVRIRKEGYNTFEGVVMCRALNPQGFSVTMDPVLLTPSSNTEVSFSAEGWGVVRIGRVSIEPPILKPGEEAQVSVMVQSPRLVKLSDMQVHCVSALLGSHDLRPDKDSPEGGQIFTGKFRVPGMKQGVVQSLLVSIQKCPYDIAPEGRARRVLLQVAVNAEERKVAEMREQAYMKLLSGDSAEAAAELKTLCDGKDPIRSDYADLGLTSMQIKDYATAVAARKRLVDMVVKEPEGVRFTAMALYAEALLAGGEPQRVLTEIAPVIESVRERERQKKVPPSLMALLGQAYLQSDHLAQAESVHQQLIGWNITSVVPAWTQFHNALRLAQAQAKVKASPNSAQARADYGRVLLDQGRWEEAAQELQAAQASDPNLPALQRDLTYALLSLNGGATRAEKSLDEAIAEAQKQAVLVNGKNRTKSKDFFAWYSLGMLLYTKMTQQQTANPSAAEEARTGCQEAFIEALKCGRNGARVNNGYSPWFGYTSARVVAIAGFAYPEANSVFIMRESLKDLKHDPNDYLALLNLGTALIDLGHADLAADPIKKALGLRPDLVEAKYAAALIALQHGDRKEAIQGLVEVTKSNPRHPMAWTKLAALYTEDGDITAASACLAAYAKFYGSKEVEITE